MNKKEIQFELREMIALAENNWFGKVKRKLSALNEKMEKEEINN